MGFALWVIRLMFMVMVLVVDMGVFVVDGLMDMPVCMAFGEVQP